MKRVWTEAQKTAIEASDCDILVSAGAGSGKTAVLTERIIRRLTKEESPAEITRMLVVTFTKAAAGELKERIAAAINEALAKNPKDKRLARQLLSLDRAKISTIHSFCLDILKEYADTSKLPGDFRIADETEITILKNSVMNSLIEELYSGDATDVKIEDFEDFADMFVGTKDDSKLADTFINIEKNLSSYPEHLEFVKHSAEMLSDLNVDFAKTPHGEEILNHVTEKFKNYRDILDDAIFEVSADEKLYKAYYNSFSTDLNFIDRIIALAKDGTFEEICKAFKDFSISAMGSIKKEELTSEIIFAKEMREEFHAARKKFTAKYFSNYGDKLQKARINTAKATMKLYALLKGFCKRFSEEKRRRSIVDFGDLERLTYELLVADNAPTPIALAIRERFDEIYIDEYQDVNAIQDAIFAAVSKGNNRFMVGDIKQAIYSFRGSAPHIFSNYRKTFSENSNVGKAIFLSDNFRCDENIIDFTNIVCSFLFKNGRGDVDYRDEDNLIHSKKDSENGESVHIVLIDKSEESDGEEDISAREAAYIAKEAKSLIKEGKKNDGTPIRPKDIAIIMRSPKSNSTVISNELEKVGIPYYNSTAGEFFGNAEVLLVLCLINIIDNPTRDIYLAGALRSPVFNFSLSELIEVRKFSPEGSLYEALVTYSEDEDFKKGKDFLDKLNTWRIKAAGMRIDHLIWYLYTDTDLLSLVYDKENATRRANLLLLYEYARRFESTSFKGLYNFIRYINDALDEKVKFESAKSFDESSDTVKIMSIHQSKGLEFPVCFICGTGKKFNDQDLRQSVVMDKKLGIALKLSDETGFARYDTVIRNAILLRIADNQLEEEMRLLYVALTRARERLYVSALVEKPDKLLDSAYENIRKLSKDTVMKNRGYMEWILTAIEYVRQKNKAPLPCTVETVNGDSEQTADKPLPEEEQPEVEISDIDYIELVKEHFDFKYPTAGAKLPAKLSVSRLYPDILDEDEGEPLESYNEESYSFSEKRPLFLSGDSSKLPATGAEKGTATHVFMQFCDFSRFYGGETEEELSGKIKEEIARLTQLKFIPKRVAELINTRQVREFFRSELFVKIKEAKNIWREKRFNVRLPAKDFTMDSSLAKELSEENILVQGVMDCFFENSDGTLTLVDYKTDYIQKGMTKEEVASLMKERHSLQLSYYKRALEKISLKKVSKVIIYSFGSGYEIEI